MMHQDSVPAAIDLVSRVQLLMAERDDLALDESTFRRYLASLMNNVVIEIRDVPAVVPQITATSVPFWLSLPHRLGQHAERVVIGASGSATPTLVLPLTA
jgi:hypothetical protein